MLHPRHGVSGKGLLRTEGVGGPDGYPDVGVAFEHADRRVAVLERRVAEPGDGLGLNLAPVVIEVLLRLQAGDQHHPDSVAVGDVRVAPGGTLGPYQTQAMPPSTVAWPTPVPPAEGRPRANAPWAAFWPGMLTA